MRCLYKRRRDALLDELDRYMSKPASDEFILGFSAIGERTIREGIKRIAG